MGLKSPDFLDLFLFVLPECFLWGAGTAIGELPPYFISRASALAKKKNNELNDLKKDKNSFVGKIKMFIYNNLKKYAFITVLLGASVQIIYYLLFFI